jgi:Fe/S biogenesis protein NfuA
VKGVFYYGVCILYIIKEPVYLVLKECAIRYFIGLLQEDGTVGVGLRLSIHLPHTDKASVNLVYCYTGEEVCSDVLISGRLFTLYIEKGSIYALRCAVITYTEIGKLVIKAPNMRVITSLKDATLKKMVTDVLKTIINPMLASHGGFVTIVDITRDKILLLEFGGNCGDCGLLGVTMEQTIKKVILKKFPSIKKIIEYKKGVHNPYM